MDYVTASADDAGKAGESPAEGLYPEDRDGGAQPDADYEKSGPVTGSEAYPLCMLSKIILRRNVRNPDRSCQLIKQSAYRGDPWEIVVNDATCGVTCFTIGEGK